MLETLTKGTYTYLLNKITTGAIGDVTEEEVKNTPEGLQYYLSLMESRQEIKDIINKYELKQQDYRGFRKLGKRFKAAMEITKIQLRNENERQKAIGAARKNRFSNLNLIVYFFNR
jgi:hypothetical protein